ncbi:MAG: hypothetical protein JWP97_4219 [Labilithrix sp.]|nr:hypothetical protein [Labilithrix sp.]
MDETLTRLAFRARGGDVEAARALLVEAAERQHGAGLERAARTLCGGAAVLGLLEQSVAVETRALIRERLPAPAAAAAQFTPAAVDLEAVVRAGAPALVVTAAWTIEGLALVPRYGSGVPYLGAALARPWLHVLGALGGRVEAPWLALRVLVALDPAKKALTEAMIRGTFAALGERAVLPLLVLLENDAPPARRPLWTKLLTDHPARIDDAALAALLDDAPLRGLALELLLRRGPSAAKHAMAFLYASAPGTRRAVAGLLGVSGLPAAIPALRDALTRERDAKTRVHLVSALEKLSGAEALVPLPPPSRRPDAILARGRAALAAPRPPKLPAWVDGSALPRLVLRDGSALSRAELESLVGRLVLLPRSDVIALLADLRRALEKHAARTLLQALRAAFVASRERSVLPDWYLRAVALLLPEHDVDLACEEADATLRTSARERWGRVSERAVELPWDPDALTGSPTRVVFAWLLHWSETAPHRRDRDRAHKALAPLARATPDAERPFVMVRRFGLDDDGMRTFRDGERSVTVRVRLSGAIEVVGHEGDALSRYPDGELGQRVKRHVAELEAALLEMRRTLAEAYAEKLVVDVTFVKKMVLGHPLWRTIAQGCVVRCEGAAQALRLSREALADLDDGERLRFVLAQVEG